MDPETEEALDGTSNVGDSNSDTTQLESSVAASEKNKTGSASPTENGIDLHDNAGYINGVDSPRMEQKELDPAEMVNVASIHILVVMKLCFMGV